MGQMLPLEHLSPQLLRDMLKQFPAPVLNPPIHAVRDLKVPGAAGDMLVRLYTPSAARNLPLIVFFHGGGFVICNVGMYDDLCKFLANYSGCAVASVEYRLAPEAPFPAPLEDCYSALKWLAAHAADLNVDPARLAVAGDSAGGNLATATALLARDRDGPALRYQALFYPCARSGLRQRQRRGAGERLPADARNDAVVLESLPQEPGRPCQCARRALAGEPRGTSAGDRSDGGI